MLVVRDPVDADWPRIAELADVAVEPVAGAPGQEEWVAARFGFEGPRRHHVALEADAVVGYGSVEARPTDDDGVYRVFLVTDWVERIDVADALWDVIATDLDGLGARGAWLREYADDERLLAFFAERGFVVGAPYDHDGARLVNLRRDW